MPGFKDVTAQVVQKLDANVPRGPGPDRLKEEVEKLSRPYGKDGRVPLYDASTNSWITSLAPNRAGGFGKKHLNDPSAINSKADSDTVSSLRLDPFVTGGAVPTPEVLVLEHQDDVQPKLYALSYPKNFASTLKKLGRMPFLVYFRPQLRQVIEQRFGGAWKGPVGYYIGYDNLANDPSRPVPPARRAEESFYYPYGWDYLYFVFWKYLNYADDPVREPFFPGLLYQIAESGRQL